MNALLIACATCVVGSDPETASSLIAMLASDNYGDREYAERNLPDCMSLKAYRLLQHAESSEDVTADFLARAKRIRNGYIGWLVHHLAEDLVETYGGYPPIGILRKAPHTSLKEPWKELTAGEIITFYQQPTQIMLNGDPCASISPIVAMESFMHDRIWYEVTEAIEAADSEESLQNTIKTAMIPIHSDMQLYVELHIRSKWIADTFIHTN